MRVMLLISFLLVILASCRDDAINDMLNREYTRTYDFNPTRVLSTDRGFYIEAFDQGSEVNALAEYFLEVDNRGNILWQVSREELIGAISPDSPEVYQTAFIDDALYLVGTRGFNKIDTAPTVWFGKLKDGAFTMIDDSVYFTNPEKFYPDLEYDVRIIGESENDVRLIAPMYRDFWTFRHFEVVVFLNGAYETTARLIINDRIDDFYELDDAVMVNGDMYLLIEGLVPEYLFKFSGINTRNWRINLLKYGPLSDVINWEGSLGSNGENLMYMFYMDIKERYNPNTGTMLQQQKSIGYYEIGSTKDLISSDTIVEKGLYNNYRFFEYDLNQIIACGDYQSDINILGTPFWAERNPDGSMKVYHFVQKKGMYLINVKALGDGLYLVAGGQGRFEKSTIRDFFISIVDVNDEQNF